MKKRLLEISLLLFAVWSAMIIILLILDLVVVQIENPAGNYIGIILVQIIKLATGGILVGGWLLGWYRLTCIYFWRRVKNYENMA